MAYRASRSVVDVVDRGPGCHVRLCGAISPVLRVLFLMNPVVLLVVG